MQGERYIGTHGPAIRDAAGWKLIVNGAGGARAKATAVCELGDLCRGCHPGRTNLCSVAWG